MSWRIIRVLGMGLSAVLMAASVVAADWNVQLQDGSAVRVDPRTNRAWVEGAAGSRPLWDGVHRLNDGSVIRIQSGVMIPERAYVEALRGTPASVPEGEIAAREDRYTAVDPNCVDLVSKTCGAGDQCVAAEGCSMARQLRQFQLEEWRETGFSNWMTEAGTQCAEALRDSTMFPRCLAKKE